jgi:hypothetical protein
MMAPPCPLCPVNNAAGSEEAGRQNYFEVHHVLSARARRLVGDDPAQAPLADRRLGAFFSLQPWPLIKDCQDYIGSEEAAKVKM